MIVVDPISVPDPGLSSPRNPGAFDFHNPSRTSHSEQAVPLGGIPRALREAAELAGIDPVAELYNEALRYAQEGHLRLARERLQMLLCMAPDDGDARLMLARVFVAGQRWSDALSALDEATNCGVDVPMSLRRAVEDHLRAERAVTEEQQNALKAREQGEVKALRSEARRLRSENAQVACHVTELEREVRKWAWATASVSALTIVFIVGSLVFGRRSAGEPVASQEAPVETDAARAVVAEAATEPVPEPIPEPIDLARFAADVLDSAPGLDGTSLQVRVEGDKVILSGEVLTFRQRKTAERVVGDASGVGSVDASAVKILVRTQGGQHVVEKGDTLSHIAHAYYGDSALTAGIEKVNKLEGTVLKIGQKLTIPPVQ